MLAPFVFLIRGAYKILPKFSLSSQNKPFDQQLLSNRHLGGYFTGDRHQKISTRDTFYTLMGMRFLSQNVTEEYIELLAKHMNAKNQVPAYFTETMFGTIVPHYKEKGYEIVDSTAIFIILLEWLMQSRSQTVKRLYLHAQRAMQYLETFIKDDVFYEPKNGSWENTRQYTDSSGLTTSVLVCQAMRSLELISMNSGNKARQQHYVKSHTRFIQHLKVKLFQSQETLPRMLAIYWSMMPSSFWRSFDQELDLTIPLITDGPLTYPSTWESWLYGIDDEHSTLVYPWIGYFWIAILGRKLKTEQAKEYFREYSEFHSEITLFSAYDQLSLTPVRRAFLSASSAHSITLSMYMAARDFCEKQELDKKVDNV